MDESIIDMEQRLAYLDKANEITTKKANELRKILEMPFIQRMKLPSQIIELQRLEDNQREAFSRIVLKYAPHLKSERGDLFAEYFTGFMSGKYSSINDYLFLDIVRRVLRDRFIDR